jgi:hypothetical protein
MLRQLLQGMLDEAVLKEGIVVKKKLKENLHIALVMTKKDMQLSLSRDKVYPSLSEWKTVLANFPYIVPSVAPIQFVDSNKRFAVRGKLPRREDVPQQLAFGAEQPAVSDDPETKDAGLAEES